MGEPREAAQLPLVEKDEIRYVCTGIQQRLLQLSRLRSQESRIALSRFMRDMLDRVSSFERHWNYAATGELPPSLPNPIPIQPTPAVGGSFPTDSDEITVRFLGDIPVSPHMVGRIQSAASTADILAGVEQDAGVSQDTLDEVFAAVLQAADPRHTCPGVPDQVAGSSGATTNGMGQPPAGGGKVFPWGTDGGGEGFQPDNGTKEPRRRKHGNGEGWGKDPTKQLCLTIDGMQRRVPCVPETAAEVERRGVDRKRYNAKPFHIDALPPPVDYPLSDADSGTGLDWSLMTSDTEDDGGSQ